MPSPTPSPTPSLAIEILATLALAPTATPPLELVVAELGLPPRVVSAELAKLERSDLVESWPDPARLGVTRVMLSCRAAARLGLRLSPLGDRWLTKLDTDRTRPRLCGR